MVVYINKKKANKQQNADQKKYNLSHFTLIVHSLIHLLKNVFNVYHMPGTVLHARGYIGE